MFVGESRQLIVDQLTVLFDEVVAGSGPRLALLVSQPGWGKTRIAQEFYRAIAARQAEPRYWPPEIVKAPSESDFADFEALTNARKAVYPTTVEVPPGAEMDWMWWGLLCNKGGDGRLMKAIFEDYQLYVHAEALMEAPIDDPLSRGFDVGSTVIGVLGLLGIAVVPPASIAITLLGAAKVGWENSDVIERFKAWRSIHGGSDHAQTLSADSSADREDEVAQLIEGLERLSQARPLVVVVDDAHFADETLVRVIDGLTKSRSSRVLVVATGWPSHLDAPEEALPFAAWISEAATDEADQLTRFDLDELSVADTEELVRDELPAAADLARDIHDRYGANLLAIRALLRLPAVKNAADDGELDKTDISELPKDVEAIYAEHWRGLPADVRHLLSLAAQSPGTRYLPDLVAAACELQVTGATARDRLSEGVSPYAWAREIDASLHSFVEPVMHDIAARRAHELLRKGEIEALREAVVGAAIGLDPSEQSPAARLELLEQHLALVDQGLAPRGLEAARSAYELAQIAAAQYDYSRAIELSKIAIAWSGPKFRDPEVLEVRNWLVLWQCALRRYEEAKAVAEELLADQMRVIGPDHVHTLMTRGHLTVLVAASGRREEALAASEELLADQVRVLGVDHLAVANTRAGIAARLNELGRAEEAVAAAEELLGDLQRALGPDHTHVLTTRNRVAAYMAESGRLEEALVATEELLADQVRVLGADHPDVLGTRGDIAARLAESGRLEEAISTTKELLADQLRVLGRDHPDVLLNRATIARWADSGPREEAVSAAEELLADQVRVLGADDRNTLVTRMTLATFKAQSGHLEAAVSTAEELLADQLRVLGPDHPDVLLNRGLITVFKAQSGDLEAAISAAEELLADQVRMLGPDHPEVMKTRAKIARWLADSGPREEAVSATEELLADQVRVLGNEHADVLQTRGDITVQLAESGRFEEAISAAEELLADEMRVRGPDHPEVLSNRLFIAVLKAQSGRHEEAISAAEELLADQVRMLGPDHPDVASTRGKIAMIARWQADSRERPADQ